MNTSEQIPDAPRFCTRVSKEEMKKNSEEYTKRELEKLANNVLQHNNGNGVSSQPSLTTVRTSNSENEKDMYSMLFECFDKMQNISIKQCELSDKFSKKNEELISAKKELVDVSEKHEKEILELNEAKNHFEKVCEEYEEENKQLVLVNNNSVFMVRRLRYELKTYKKIACFLFVMYVLSMYLCLEMSEMTITNYTHVKEHLYELFEYMTHP